MFLRLVVLLPAAGKYPLPGVSRGQAATGETPALSALLWGQAVLAANPPQSTTERRATTGPRAGVPWPPCHLLHPEQPPRGRGSWLWVPTGLCWAPGSSQLPPVGPPGAGAGAAEQDEIGRSPVARAGFQTPIERQKATKPNRFLSTPPRADRLGWLWEPPMQAQGFQEGEAPFLAGLHPRSRGTAPFRAEPSTPGCPELSVPHFGSPCPQPAGWELPRPWHAKDGETGTWPPAPGAQSLPRAAAAALHPGCALKFKTDPA